ncbi:MAG: class I SAM-dependent methyltransferase [Endozoicomonadaceae bacterium]|nr:class I SAM-dependent methyltransferase [Endozoicomonadaceae bacterium]
MSLLTNSSQLLVKNSEMLEAERILVVQPEKDSFITQLLALSSATVDVYTTSEAVRFNLSAAGIRDENVSYDEVVPMDREVPDTVILYLQKSREYMNYLLAMILPLVAETGQILLVGENRCGIKSWQKRLAVFGKVGKIDSARHCSLFSLTLTGKPESFVMEDWKAFFRETVNDTEVQAVTLPGVFNHGQLDKGTRLLLETFDVGLSGDILDFGCGSGVVGAWLGKRFSGTRVTLLDNDAMALASTRETCRINGVEPMAIIASDGLANVRGSYHVIVSNPPFHDGVRTQYETTEQFLRQSKMFLKPKGRLRMVANSFLRYQPMIEAVFGHCRTLKKRDGFSVYEASNR